MDAAKKVLSGFVRYCINRVCYGTARKASRGLIKNIKF